MKKIIVFFFSTSVTELPFVEPSYYDSCKRLVWFAGKRNIDIRFVFGSDNYKAGEFSSFWKFINNKLVEERVRFGADLVVTKTRDLPVFPNTLNSPQLEEICRDKYKTAKTFPEFSKTTVLITNNNPEEIQKLKTALIVIKPRFGALGENIHVIKKDDYQNDSYAGKDFIAQEFIDSKKGIPGLINRRHELRLYIFNRIMRAAYIRIPAPNSFIANISKGGKEMQIDNRDIPESVMELKNNIDNKFIGIRPRLYTIDVMFEKNKPWLVELNDTPGMPDISVQPLTDTFLQSMLDLFT